MNTISTDTAAVHEQIRYAHPIAVIPAKNPVGVIGLIAGIVGVAVALIPFATFFAWFLTLPALVLGIVGVTRRDKPKKAAKWAIALSVVGWIASIAMSIVTFAVFGTIDVSAGA